MEGEEGGWQSVSLRAQLIKMLVRFQTEERKARWEFAERPYQDRKTVLVRFDRRTLECMLWN